LDKVLWRPHCSRDCVCTALCVLSGARSNKSSLIPTGRSCITCAVPGLSGRPSTDEGPINASQADAEAFGDSRRAKAMRFHFAHRGHAHGRIAGDEARFGREAKFNGFECVEDRGPRGPQGNCFGDAGTGLGAEAEAGRGKASEFFERIDRSISCSFVISRVICSWSAVSRSTLRAICS